MRMTSLGPEGLSRNSHVLFLGTSTKPWNTCSFGKSNGEGQKVTDEGRYGTAYLTVKRWEMSDDNVLSSHFPRIAKAPFHPYPVFTFLPSVHHFPREMSPSSLEFRVIFSNCAAALARCDRMGELPNDKACFGLHQIMTTCVFTTL